VFAASLLVEMLEVACIEVGPESVIAFGLDHAEQELAESFQVIAFLGSVLPDVGPFGFAAAGRT
jgi:hypothetical protein